MACTRAQYTICGQSSSDWIDVAGSSRRRPVREAPPAAARFRFEHILFVYSRPCSILYRLTTSRVHLPESSLSSRCGSSSPNRDSGLGGNTVSNALDARCMQPCIYWSSGCHQTRSIRSRRGVLQSHCTPRAQPAHELSCHRSLHRHHIYITVAHLHRGLSLIPCAWLMVLTITDGRRVSRCYHASSRSESFGGTSRWSRIDALLWPFDDVGVVRLPRIA